MRHSLAIALLLTCARPGCSRSLPAQVVEVHGGSSTLFDSKGGEVDIKAKSYDASFGAGTIGPTFIGGASLAKRYEGSTFTLGTETIPFNLPTDIFDATHFLTTVGGSIRSKLPNASSLLFGGMMSQNYDDPFFTGTRGIQPAAVFLFDGRIAPSLSVASRVALTRQITIIEGVQWRPVNWAQLAASGGVGAGKGYGAVSARVKYSIFDLKSAYIQASPGFRRANVANVLVAEPDRLNAVVTVSPNRSFSATVGHQQYLTPIAGPQAQTQANSSSDSRSSIDQVALSGDLKGVGLSGSTFRSSYQGGANKAFVLSASRTFGPRLQAQGSYFYSTSTRGHATDSLVANVKETLSPRWTLSEIVNNSNGQTTVGFGTSFLSNLAVLNADYETYYVPTRLPSPFEQVLILDADLNLFGRATLHGDTFVAPDGSVKHTISANGTFARNSAAPANAHNPLERYVISGRVVDELNRPVEGAALLIDRIPVYTDSDGNFVMHERQPRYHSLEILVSQFLGGGEYMVVNASHNIHSTLPDQAVVTTVVVQKVPKICGRGLPCKG